MQPVSPVHVVGHVVLVPLQTYELHEGLPAPPSTTVVQVPVAHVAHAPMHALLQQMPAASHTPLAH
jgi:hypothetical protein